MPKRTQTDRCIICGGHQDEVGRLSLRKKCERCACLAMLDNARELRAHTGPRFDSWRQACARAFGAPVDGA